MITTPKWQYWMSFHKLWRLYMYLKWDQVMHFLRKLPPFANFPNNCQKKKISSSCWPVCLYIHPFVWSSSAPTGRFLWSFMLEVVLPTYQTTVKFDVTGTQIIGTSCENVCTFKSLILIMGRDCVLYEIWAEAEETDDNLKITTETGCDVCEVWAGN